MRSDRNGVACCGMQKDTSSKYLSEDELLAFIVSLVLPPASGNDTNYKAERRAMLAAKSTLTYATASRGGETTELRWSELMAPELNAHLGSSPRPPEMIITAPRCACCM